VNIASKKKTFPHKGFCAVKHLSEWKTLSVKAKHYFLQGERRFFAFIKIKQLKC